MHSCLSTNMEPAYLASHTKSGLLYAGTLTTPDKGHVRPGGHASHATCKMPKKGLISSGTGPGGTDKKEMESTTEQSSQSQSTSSTGPDTSSFHQRDWQTFTGHHKKMKLASEKYPQPIWAQSKPSASAEGQLGPQSQMSFYSWKRGGKGKGSQSSASVDHWQDASNDHDHQDWYDDWDYDWYWEWDYGRYCGMGN